MRRLVRPSQAFSRGYVSAGRPKPKWSAPSKYNKPLARVPSKGQPSSQPPQKGESDIQHSQSSPVPQTSGHEPSKLQLVSTALAENESSDLVAPVRIPHDPDGILQPDHPAMTILNHSALVIQRQIEMMNVFLGFEQANRYVIMDGRGETIGYLAEQDHGIGQAMARQAFRTHRSFTAHIFDKEEREVLRIHRPFSWINSRIRIYDPINGSESNVDSSATQGLSPTPAMNQQSAASVSSLALADMRIIGEAQQEWALLRRKYNLFTFRPFSAADSDASRLTSGDLPLTESKALVTTSRDVAIESGMAQFSHISEPVLSWDFTLRSEASNIIGSVNRSFAGFAREIFTDSGVYALRMDSAAVEGMTEQPGGESALTLDQRAVMLATAVSIDFDYFSRHSSAGGGIGFFPMWFPGMGGAGAEAGAVGAGAGAAGEVGAAEGVGGVVGGAARGAGVGEGAIAGAGTMAGYEAMRRGGQAQQDDASPVAGEPYQQDPSQGPPAQNGQGEDVWGAGEEDPWGKGSQQGGGDVGGGSEGGGGGFDVSDWF